MGFLDTLGAMLTPASYAVGGYMQGRQQAQQRDFQNNLQLMQLQRQQRADQATSDYRAAQMEDLKAQAAARAEQTTERKAKAVKDQQQDEGAFDILSRSGWLPQGVTPDMRSMGGWSDKLNNALKAKTVDDQIKARGDIQEHIATLNRQSQEDIHSADRSARAAIETQREGAASALEAQRQAGKTAKGGPAGGAQGAARIVQYGAGVHALVNVLKTGDALDQRFLPAVIPGEGTLLDPHAKGLGAEIGAGLVKALDPVQGQYNTAIAQYTMPVIHSINASARVSAEQANLLNQSIRFQAGEHKTARAQKMANAVDLINEARAGIPADAAAQVEATISPDDMAFLKSHGFGSAPTGQGMSLIKGAGIDLTGGTGGGTAAPAAQDPYAGGGGGGGKPSLSARVHQLKAQGISKDAARQTLINEGYNLSGTP